jgi:hypothetical protein
MPHSLRRGEWGFSLPPHHQQHSLRDTSFFTVDIEQAETYNHRKNSAREQDGRDSPPTRLIFVLISTIP